MKSSPKTSAIALLFGSWIMIISSCQEKVSPPVVTTANISEITQTSAVSGGNVTDDGGADVTSRGICWGTNANPTTSSNKTTDGTGQGIFISNLSGLTANTTYYVRAYANNSEGVSYGNELSFTTNPVAAATLTTTLVSAITTTTAVSGGNISSDGGGAITSRGVCWSKSQNPTTDDSKTTDGSGTGVFTSNLTGLTASSTYYIRAYAINGAGTSYGNQQVFTTSPEPGGIIFNPVLTYGTVTDIEGNIYKTIVIGSRTWMAENLKTTKFNDNTPIENVPDFSQWLSLTSPAYCWYNNDAATYKALYGALYNWEAVGSNKLCPTGWHVPTRDEWTTLQTFLGGPDVAGSKMKETGTTHWKTPNAGATNESGFTGLPGAQRDVSNNFGDGAWIGIFGQWWSSTSESPGFYYECELNYNDNTFTLSVMYGKMGISVRCIKD